MLTLGLFPPRWARADYPKLTGVGLLDSWSFEPLEWSPNYPNPAFLMMGDADAFWAAKQVAAFTNDDIRAIVETGQYSDKRATDWVTDSLSQRRDKLVAAWFSRVLPLDQFRVADGQLTFADLSVTYGLGKRWSYTISWFNFDNDQNRLTVISDAKGPKVLMFSGSVHASPPASIAHCGVGCEGMMP